MASKSRESQPKKVKADEVEQESDSEASTDIDLDAETTSISSESDDLFDDGSDEETEDERNQEEQENKGVKNACKKKKKAKNGKKRSKATTSSESSEASSGEEEDEDGYSSDPIETLEEDDNQPQAQAAEASSRKKDANRGQQKQKSSSIRDHQGDQGGLDLRAAAKQDGRRRERSKKAQRHQIAKDKLKALKKLRDLKQKCKQQAKTGKQRDLAHEIKEYEKIFQFFKEQQQNQDQDNGGDGGREDQNKQRLEQLPAVLEAPNRGPRSARPMGDAAITNAPVPGFTATSAPSQQGIPVGQSGQPQPPISAGVQPTPGVVNSYFNNNASAVMSYNASPMAQLRSDDVALVTLPTGEIQAQIGKRLVLGLEKQSVPQTKNYEAYEYPALVLKRITSSPRPYTFAVHVNMLTRLLRAIVLLMNTASIPVDLMQINPEQLGTLPSTSTSTNQQQQQ